MMNIAKIIRWMLPVGALLASCASAGAAQLVVIEARAIALRPGAVVDDTKPLVLKQGQHVTLLSETGATLKLDGPYDKVPSTDQIERVDIKTVLAALVTQRQARTSEVGTTRGTTVVKLPEPWLIDATHNGNVCLRDGDAVVFWRPSSAKAAAFTVMPDDRSWRAQANWPAGSDQLPASADAPVHGGATYVVSIDGAESAVTVNTLPAVLTNDSMRAAWMAEKGCEAQAEALLNMQ
jgi:hypothetical protein